MDALPSFNLPLSFAASSFPAVRKPLHAVEAEAGPGKAERAPDVQGKAAFPVVPKETAWYAAIACV